MQTFDFAVIGGGSAGFNAARLAGSLGRKTALIDGAEELGGLCILKGCMPSKTLLYAAEVLHLARSAGRFGLRVASAQADMRKVAARKRRIIADFASYRQQAMAKGPFTLIRANARFIDPHTVALSNGRKLRAQQFLIATGSKVAVPAVEGLAESACWTSDDVLDLDFLPSRVIVLGGGVVACELAQLLSRLGSRVTLLQRSPQILRDHSPEAAGAVTAALREEGLEVITGTQLQRVNRTARGYTVEYAHEGRTHRRSAPHLVNALGREPNTAALDLAAAGVRVLTGGRVETNRWQQTSQPHIYAGGDCSGPAEIVHVAIQQGELAARHAAGVRGLKPVDYSLLLNVVFTDPQVATLGRLERDLQADGVPYLAASYPFNDHGKSILMEALHGHVKVLAEPRRGRLLGVEIVGPSAGELIHAFTGPLALRATAADLLRAPWYHPTLAEILTYPLEEIVEKLGR
jgi:pyruvate/2-oxoglutarate dehydrogenase complex dihydrolipoamide dehydrogenase (E3) component